MGEFLNSLQYAGTQYQRGGEKKEKKVQWLWDFSRNPWINTIVVPSLGKTEKKSESLWQEPEKLGGGRVQQQVT